MQGIIPFRFLLVILLFFSSSQPLEASIPVNKDTLKYSTYPPKEDPPKKNKLAVWSLILAGGGFLLTFVPYFSILSPFMLVGGIVTGILALGQIKRKKQKGTGLAIAALIIGGVSIIAAILAVLILLSIFN